MESLPFQYHLLAGACAGISEICIMYPLDFVKTQMQIKTSVKSADLKRCRLDETMTQTFTRIVQQEGVSKLYKGIISPILLETPKRAIKFASNDFFQQFYKKNFNVNNVNQSISILAGASAGAMESFLVTPFDLVKIRLQNSKELQNSFLKCFKSIVKEYGIRGVMLGWEPTVWRHLVRNASYFGIIFHIKTFLNNHFPDSSKVGKNLVAGSLGGCLSCFLSVPFDVVKSRVQNGDTDALKKYRWAWKAVNVIRIEEGLPSLYKGMVPIICRMGPSGAYLYVTFTTLIEFFQNNIILRR